MKALTSTVQALVLSAINMEETNQEILRTVKEAGHKVSIEQIISVRDGLTTDAVVVLDGGEQTVVVDSVVSDKQTKLAAMLAASKQLAEVKAEVQKSVKNTSGSRSTVTLVKVATSSSKDQDGKSIQRRNTNVSLRSVAVVTSEALKTCWIGSHLGFATKTNEGALNIFRKAPQQALKVMQKATDLVLLVTHTNIEVGDSLEAAKAETYDKYLALGYQMVCRRGKVSTPVVTVPVAEEASTEASTEVTTEVTTEATA